MASPQLEHGYTRTANELSEAIMQSNFSKRQRNILDLIIRMSYGCGKKSALLRYSDFELVGVYKVDIKKELDHLSSAHVLSIQYVTGSPLFRIGLNKNYDQWRINIVKGYSAEKWEQLLRRNLDDKVSETLTPSENEVSKTLTDSKGVVSNLLTEQNRTVSKILTDTPKKVSIGAESGLPKERSIKEIDFKEKDLVVAIDQNKTPLSPQEGNSNIGFKDVIQAWTDNIYPMISPAISDELKAWLEQDGMPPEVIVAAIKKAASMGNKNQAYINGILRGWSGKGIKTLAAVAADEEAWHNSKSRDKPDTCGTKNLGKVVGLNGRTGQSRGDPPRRDPVDIGDLIVR